MQIKQLLIFLIISLSVACNKASGENGDSDKEVVPPTITNQIYSVSAGPGADASTSIGISWATDLDSAATYVLYTKASDASWKKAKKATPEQEYFCTVFDGIASVDASGNDIVENAKFTKCGATLSGLDPDTDYKYVIKARDGSQTKEKKFRTAGAQNWSCCLISDFHSYTPLAKRLTYSMGVIDKMQTLDPSLDWVLSAGDVVAWGGSYSFWKAFFEQDNCAELMWARANGNHDNWTKESKSDDIPNEFFRGTSYFPQNGYKGEEGVCYHFRYGNTLFVVLNTEDMDDGAEFNSAAAWLKEVLDAAKQDSNPPTFTVVCMHYEWFYGTSGKASEYKRWYRIFDSYGVDLAYSGNDHVYLRTQPIYNGQATTSDAGTVYLQTPSSDNDRGRDLDAGEVKNPKLIACRWTEGDHTVGAIHMEVNDKKMVLTLIDRNGTKVDETEIYPKK